MEVKPGYKQTEIGVIPEDWEVYTIQELIDQGCILYHMDGNHGSFYPRNKEFKTHGVPYIGANDFEQGSVSFLKCKYLSYHRASSMKKGIARDGDILFAHNATVGPVARLNTEYPFVILSTSATAYRTDNIRLFNEWLLYIMQSDFFVRQYTANMSQTTRNQVPITMQRKLLVPVSRPDEQNLIAAVLSNIDSLITSLEKLIEKKKLIMQGVMQELLTGKRRLPGFSGEWEARRLGDLFKLEYGKPKKESDRVESARVPVYGSNGVVGYASDELTSTPTIIIGRKGAAGLIHHSSGGCWPIDTTFYIEFDDYTESLFYYYLLQCAGLDGIKSDSAVPGLNRADAYALMFKVPSKEERIQIAEILLSIDQEITYLTDSLDKHKLLKQAMMQELLTGRIRLI